MKITEVPQEDSILEGHRRACYAEDEQGRYVIVQSRGWEVEKIVNAEATAEVRAALEQARRRVLTGHASALEYHRVRCQMSVGLLAANAGVWRFRVYRHLKPRVFSRLKPAVLRRYALALGISVEELQTVPVQASSN